jgi:hypothetical protein
MQTETTSQRYERRDGSQDARRQLRLGKLAPLMRDAASSRLFLMTTLGAATGQVPVLAAEGSLASPGVVVTVGLTIVAGVGAFLAAIEETSLDDPRGRVVFTATAALSIVANVAAAGIGLAFAHLVTLDHVRYFAALALGVVALEIASQRAFTLPRGVPVPGVLVVVGLLVEVLV